MPVPDLLLAELPAEKHRLVTANGGKVDQPLVDVLDLRAVGDDLVDHAGELPCFAFDVRGGCGEGGRRDPAAVAANVPFELFLTGEGVDVRAPPLDHLLDEGTDLGELRIRFFGGEVPHRCNPMHHMRPTAATNGAVPSPGDAKVLPTRLACWIALVAAIATLNYVARFTGGNGSGSGRNAVYSWSTFANGMIVYAFWLGLVLAIAIDRWDLLALRRPATSWGRAAGLAVSAVLAIYVLEAIVSVIPLPQSPSHEQALTPTHWESAHAAAFGANLVLFAVVAPIVEELTFRGVGQSLLAFLGRWPSMIVVGFAFGAAHGLVEALLVLVPFGIALAWLRDRTKSVVPGMVVHGLFNGIALAAAVLAT